MVIVERRWSGEVQPHRAIYCGAQPLVVLVSWAPRPRLVILWRTWLFIRSDEDFLIWE